ncbi:MAG: PfkB family carbohydrate kinase [Anaerolineaceae bacterium]
MLTPIYLEPIDYLVIGHIVQDITPNGMRIGGSAAYAALTAKALGLRPGIVTSWSMETTSPLLADIPIVNFPSEVSTTFENIMTPEGRLQYLYKVAPSLGYNLIPDSWRNTPIIHLGPVAQEVDPTLVRHFPSSFIGVSPQGWLRTWDEQGRVTCSEWPEASFVLQGADAAVLSLEDVDNQESRIEEMAAFCHVLAVTEGKEGSRVYWNGDARRFSALRVTEIDSTGAGDIYAAAFFIRLHQTHNPWEAARFATALASYSITRYGLEGIPTQEEINECMVEVF